MAAGNTKRQQLEKQLKETKEYLRKYRAGELSVVTSNLQVNKLKGRIERLQKQISNLPKSKPTPKASTSSKPLEITIKGGQKTGRSGNIGRTTTKFDTPAGKARVAPKPKAKAAPKKKKVDKKRTRRSGMGMAAYQRLTGSGNRRK